MATAKSKIEITAVDRTKRAFSSVKGGLSSVGKAVFSVKGAIAGLAGAAGFGALVKSSLASVDALAKMSDRLGIATQDLAALHFAAEQMGTSSQTVDKALEGLNRRLGEASAGFGTAKRALDQLGLSAEHLKEVSPAQAMAEISDAMKEVGSQAEKAQIANDLFGRSGMQMINMLDAGSEGLGAFADEAERLGITISRVDAAKIEAANDAWNRVKTSIKGVAQQISVALAPFLEWVADKFTEMATRGVNWGDITVKAIRFVATGVAYLVDAWTAMKATFVFLQIKFQEFKNFTLNGIREMLLAMDTLPGAAGQFTEATSNMFWAIQEGNKTVKELQMTLGNLVEESAVDKVTSVFDEIQAKSQETAEVVANTLKPVLVDVAETQVEAAAAGANGAKDIQKKQTDGEKKELNKRKETALQVSKAIFGDSKAGKISEALINTYTGVSRALAEYPPPISFAMAAAQAAIGLKQVAAIKSTNYGGGGGAAGAGGGGGVPVGAQASAQQAQGPTEGPREINIGLQGSTFSAESVRDLMGEINEQIGDGVTLGT